MSADVAPRPAQTTLQDPATTGISRQFYGWLGAATVSVLGDAVLYFALGWAATGIGPAWAGLTLTMILLPRAALLLLGGAVADRWGARRIMVVGDAAMCALTVSLALAAHVWAISGFLLMGTGLAIGLVGAFYLPATGSFPRLLVADDQLPRALAMRQSAAQIVGLAGAPAGGALVAAGGLVAVALVDASTFAVVLAVLLLIRPRRPPRPPSGCTSVFQDVAAGIRVVLADRTLRALLVATGLVAAFVLPMTALCVPLLVRGHGWNPAAAGLIVGASACGGLSVSLFVGRRGTFARTGLVAAVGPLLAACGMAGVAIAPTLPLTLIGAVVQGAGTALFASHLAPMVMAGIARTHLARAQSMLVLVQTVPLLFSNNAVAAMTSHSSAKIATLVCACGTAVAGLNLIRIAATSLGTGRRANA